jgi:GNAT superfamily N-acetyltransferase
MAAPRKSFSGRGRKARGLVPLVEGTGRLRRPPPSERPESVGEVVAIALAQPHRRGFEHGRDAHLGTTVGRMVEAHPEWWGKGCPPKASFLEAARRYQKDWTSYQAAVTGTRRPLAVTDGGTRIDDPERELKEHDDASRNWADARSVLRVEGDLACHITICDYREETWVPPDWIVRSLPIALRALIQHYGLEAS